MSPSLQIIIESFYQNIIGLNIIPSTFTKAKYHFATFTQADYLLIGIGAFIAFLTSYLIGKITINLMQNKLDDATKQLLDKAKHYNDGYVIYLLLLSSVQLGCVLPIIAGLLKTSPLKTSVILIIASLIAVTEYLY